MNGFTENRASGETGSAGRLDDVLTWEAALGMLPLVGRIAADVADRTRELAALQPEWDRLDRQRHRLAWPERSRRYQLQDEIARVQTELRGALAELDALGVALLGAAAGLVGFPTLVNNRRAFFSWKPGEESLAYWSYAGDAHRRAVPVAWTTTPEAEQVRRKMEKT